MQVGKTRSRLEIVGSHPTTPREYELDDLEGFDSPESDPNDISDVSDILRKAGNIDPSAARVRSWISSLSNFSAQYNLGVAGVVHQIMKSHDDAIGHNVTPDYPEPDWLKYSLLGVVFVGNVIGMITMGRYVDQVGPRKAMLTTLGFVLAGSLGSALLPFGSPAMIYFIICCCRFILGIGVGGIYPVGAVTASATPATDPKELANRIGKSFIWQMPGAITPYIVASLLLRMEAYPGITAFQFRFLFFLGAVPAAAVFILTYLQPVESAPAPSPVSRLPGSRGASSAAADTQAVLLGTASAWFLFDVVFYGTVIFLPTITEKIFANDSATLAEMMNFSLCLICMMVPGAVLTVIALKYIPAKMVCVIGFWGMGFTYLIVSILDPLLTGSTGFVMFLLFGTNIMAVNFGPNVCTYILPMLYFHRDVRGKYHGISAAWGKAGAAVGTFMFLPLLENFGLSGVLVAQAFVCAMGASLTFRHIPEHPIRQ